MVSTWYEIDNKLQLPQGQQSELCIVNYSLFFKKSHKHEKHQFASKRIHASGSVGQLQIGGHVASDARISNNNGANNTTRRTIAAHS
jgi:hypothetical protein